MSCSTLRSHEKLLKKFVIFAKEGLRVVPTDPKTKKLHEKLHAELMSLLEAEGGKYPSFEKLFGILTQYRKRFLLSFHLFTAAKDEIIFVTVSCDDDSLLEKLAVLNFPRGFAIKWNRVLNELAICGFDPKFGNDGRNTTKVADAKKTAAQVKKALEMFGKQLDQEFKPITAAKIAELQSKVDKTSANVKEQMAAIAQEAKKLEKAEIQAKAEVLYKDHLARETATAADKEIIPNFDKYGMSLKVSGCLIGLYFFEFQGKIGVAIYSKNSMGNKYCSMFEEYFFEHMAAMDVDIEALAHEMCSQNMTAYCEFITTNDSSHGYNPHTTICVWHIGSCGASNSATAPEHLQKIDCFMQKLPPDMFIQFLQKYKMDYGAQFRINDATLAKTFYEFISKAHVRNSMTYSSFMRYWKVWAAKYPQAFECIPGSFDHGERISDVLEGIVIRMDKTVEKFKFPFYTLATLGFRAFLDAVNRCYRAMQEANGTPKKDCGNFPWGKPLTQELLDVIIAAAKDYLERWICQDSACAETKQFIAVLEKSFATFAESSHELYANFLASGSSDSFHNWLRDLFMQELAQASTASVSIPLSQVAYVAATSAATSADP